MIDIETKRIVGLLDSRETQDVTEWLKTYPNLSVVSRDGSISYASAITKAHPNAIQVSDRFHLVKGLTDALKQHLTQLVNVRFRIKTDAPCNESAMENGYWTKDPINDDKPTKIHKQNTEKKEKTVEKVRELQQKGYSQMEIIKETGLSSPTIKKYLRSDFNPENVYYGTNVYSKIKPYTEDIKKMLSERKTFKAIEETLRSNGYKGAASTIRMYATRERRLMKEAAEAEDNGSEQIERKWLVKLLYKPLDRVKEISEQQMQRIISEYPIVSQIYDNMKSFKEILFSKKTEDLDFWIEEAGLLNLEEVNSFINGINRDIDAVKNAIKYEYNNGLAEGSVNKIKLIKRIMYGRCGFTLLKNKILSLELRKPVN
jgi:transposase